MKFWTKAFLICLNFTSLSFFFTYIRFNVMHIEISSLPTIYFPSYNIAMWVEKQRLSLALSFTLLARSDGINYTFPCNYRPNSENLSSNQMVIPCLTREGSAIMCTQRFYLNIWPLFVKSWFKPTNRFQKVTKWWGCRIGCLLVRLVYGLNSDRLKP